MFIFMLIEKLSSKAEDNVADRPRLEQISRDGVMKPEVKSKLHRMLYESGPGNGTLLNLPFDQLIEHGIGHTLKWERAADPRAVIELANKGCFSAIALSIGQAEKYRNLINKALPLIVKLDGHLLIGKEVAYARQSTMSSVARAVDARADAIGFTFYVGGEETERDMERCAKIVEEAHNAGLPVFMWAYARGPLVEKMGADSLYWCSQAMSVAESLGVDVVKQKFPRPVAEIGTVEEYRKNLGEKGYLTKSMPEVGRLLELEPQSTDTTTTDLSVKRLSFAARCVPYTFAIASGGPTDTMEKLLATTRIVMDAGWEGVIAGRNLWGVEIEEGLRRNAAMVKIMREEKYGRS